jgi:hypothetical protein
MAVTVTPVRSLILDLQLKRPGLDHTRPVVQR